MVCAGEGQITLALVGAGHIVYTCDPRTDTHTADLSMQTLRGAAICGLVRVFGWHHLVLPGAIRPTNRTGEELLLLLLLGQTLLHGKTSYTELVITVV